MTVERVGRWSGRVQLRVFGERIVRSRVVQSSIAALILSSPAMAMPPAATHAGYDAGAEAGLGISHGSKVAADGDFDFGIKTNWLGATYTDAVAELMTTARDEDLGGEVGTRSLRATLLTLGIRQTLPTGGDAPLAGEAGLSLLNANAGAGLHSTNVGGYVGVRGTWTQFGSTAFSGMVRYHFVGAGFWQAGLGYSGPIGSGSGMRYQLDYYHTNGRFISPGGGLPGVSGNTDTILVGVRWTGGR